MCKVMEDMRNETERQRTVEIAQRMLNMGLSHVQIAEATDLTIEQVKEIAGQKTA